MSNNLNGVGNKHEPYPPPLTSQLGDNLDASYSTVTKR
jgi:hypothetical protein